MVRAFPVPPVRAHRPENPFPSRNRNRHDGRELHQPRTTTRGGRSTRTFRPTTGPGRVDRHRHAAGLPAARRIWRDPGQRCVPARRRRAAAPARARGGAGGLMVVHTREGPLPDLSDLPPAKLKRGKPSLRIGDPGPYGRILIRGEYGQDIIDELTPIAGEVVLDKPGKGAFYATGLSEILASAGITTLIVTGVTTEVCVHTTVREANDRGFDVLVLSDCVGSYFPEFQRVGVEMISAQGGIFGWVADSAALLQVLPQPASMA